MKNIKARRIAAITAAVVILAAMFPIFAPSAVTDISINFNGTTVDYTQIDDGTGTTGDVPQVIADRAMVPLRKTMTYYDIDLQWNAETRTMTMTYENAVTTHVLGSSVLIKNNQRLEYDKTSEVVDDKTLMPNIMIAEIINCDTWWDAATRTVYMRTRENTPAPARPAPAAPTAPEIVTAPTQNRTQLNTGEELIITVTANSLTSRVALFDPAGNMLHAESNSTTVGEYRSFVLRYTPATGTGEWTNLSVRPGDASGYKTDTAKPISVRITQAAINVTATLDNKPQLNEDAKITVVAPGHITKVRLTNKSSGRQYEQTEHTAHSTSQSVTGNRRFSFDIKMEQAGKFEFGIEVSTGGDYISVTQTVTVDVANPAAAVKLEIKEVTHDTTKSYKQNDEVEITVRTSTNTAYVQYYDDYTRMYSARFNTTSFANSDYKEFKFKVRLNNNADNKFRIIAVDENEAEVTREYTVKLNDVGLIESIRSINRGGGIYELTFTLRDSVAILYVTGANGIPIATPLGNPSNGRYTVVIEVNAALSPLYIVVMDTNYNQQTIQQYDVTKNYP